MLSYLLISPLLNNINPAPDIPLPHYHPPFYPTKSTSAQLIITDVKHEQYPKPTSLYSDIPINPRFKRTEMDEYTMVLEWKMVNYLILSIHKPSALYSINHTCVKEMERGGGPLWGSQMCVWLGGISVRILSIGQEAIYCHPFQIR